MVEISSDDKPEDSHAAYATPAHMPLVGYERRVEMQFVAVGTVRRQSRPPRHLVT